MKYLKSVSVISIAVFISACALFGDKIAGEVANVIEDYCKEPQQARELYRDTINAELAAAGHTISVTCAGDTTP